MNCNLFSWPMTRQRSNSHLERPDMLWRVKTITFIQQNCRHDLNYAWKFKVRNKKQWTEHINTSVHIEELWHSVLSQHASELTTWGSNRESKPYVHENHLKRRSSPSPSSSASTWSAWLLLQTQMKGLSRGGKNLLSCWSLQISLEESFQIRK